MSLSETDNKSLEKCNFLEKLAKSAAVADENDAHK